MARQFVTIGAYEGEGLSLSLLARLYPVIRDIK